MANIDIQALLLTLLGRFDPSLDTAEGSPVDRQVVQPIISRLGEDPLSTDIRSFLVAHLTQFVPDIDVRSAGGQFESMVITPIELLFRPFRRELAQVKATKSLADPSSLTDVEMDLLAANMLASRQTGERARVAVRCYFNTKQSVAVEATVRARTPTGLQFYAVTAQRVTSDTLGQNVEGSQYYLDLEFEAAEEGEQYNVGPGEISEVVGLAGVVAATNKVGVTSPGSSQESNVGFKARIQAGIGERTPNTAGGIANKLYDRYPTLRNVHTIGFGDPEMKRDVLRGTVELDDDSLGLGPVVTTASDVAGATLDLTATDSSGPGLPSLTLPFEDDDAVFKTTRLTSASGAFDDVAVGNVVHYRGVDRQVVEKISANEIKVDDFSVVAKSPNGYTDRHYIGDTLTPFALALRDGGVSFLQRGVSVGDFLRVEGTWPAAGAQPTSGQLLAGPGNTQTVYFIVVGVEPNGVQVSRYLTTEYTKNGGRYRFVLTNLVGAFVVGETITGASSGRTAVVVAVGSDYLDLDAASGDFTDGETITGGTSTASATNDTQSITGVKVTAGGTVTLHASAGALFTAAPAVQVNDFLTIWKVNGSGTFNPEEWAISAVNSNGLELSISASAAEYTSSYDVKWAVRRGTGNGGVAQNKLLLGATSGVEWAILRYRADIRSLTNPEAYAWVETNDTNESAQVRTQLTAADVAARLQLTVSGVPAGVPFPSRPIGNVEVEPDGVHIGGCMDAYTHQTAYSELSVDVLVEPGEPIVAGTDLSCVGSTDYVSADAFSDYELGTTHVLVIEEGEYKGAYRIVASGVSGTLRIDVTIDAAFTGLRYYVTNLAALSFTTPKRFLHQDGTTLETANQSYEVVDAAVNFQSLGVEDGDIVEVLTGNDIGKFTVVSVVNTHTLKLANAMTTSVTGIYYQVYRAKSAPLLPFRRVTHVELLSGDGTELGVVIPYADPIDIRSQGLVSHSNGLMEKRQLALYQQSVGEFSLRDVSETLATGTLGDDIGAGAVLEILDGANIGQFSVVAVFGNIVYLNGRSPFYDTLVSPTATLTYAAVLGVFTVDTVVYINGSGTTIGTIISVGSGTMVIQLATPGQMPEIGNTIRNAGSSMTGTVSTLVADINVRIASPSSGKLRAYFYDPTVFEVKHRGASDETTTIFSTEDGKTYAPDPKTNHVYVDATGTETGRYLVNSLRIITLTGVTGTFAVGQTLEITSSGDDIGTIVYVGSGVVWVRYSGPGTPTASVAVRNTATTASGTVSSVTTKTDVYVSDTDLEVAGVAIGDRLEPTTKPVTGTVNLASGANISGTTFTLLVGELSHTVTFSGTNPVPIDQVTPRGIKQQINAANIGVTATIVVDGAARYLQLHSNEPIVIDGSQASATLLGFGALTTSNTSESAFSEAILTVKEIFNPYGVVVAGADSGTAADLTFEQGIKCTLSHQGMQRFGPLDMVENVENGLYYVDVSVVAIRPGSEYDLADGEALTSSGHISYGYRLRSNNDALTYSMIEDTDIEFTGLVLDQALEDSLENATPIPSKTVRVYYEYGDVTMAAQALLLKDDHRVVNNNPLTKTIPPALVRIAISYAGGSRTAIVKDDIVELINETGSDDELEVADVYAILARRSATRITGGIELVAIRHNDDRTIDAVRSKDRLSVGRTSHLVADEEWIEVTRS